MVGRILGDMKNGLYAIFLNIFQNVVFLFYTIIHDINYLIFLFSNCIHNNSAVIAAASTATLVCFEIYYAAATITAMTIPAVLLTAIPISIVIWQAILHTSYIIKEYYRRHQETKHILNINPGRLSKYPSYFTAAIAALIALAVTLLIILPPFISFMLPAAAFMLEAAVPIFSTISSWIFNILNAMAVTNSSSAEYSSSAAAEGDATAILIFIAVILALFLTAIILSVLAKTIVYFGPTYLAFYLINFVAIGFVAASMLDNSMRAIEQSNRALNTPEAIIYYFISQFGMLARAITTTALVFLALDLIEVALMTLISPYATYILISIGVIALAVTAPSSKDDRLIVAGVAIFYTAFICYDSVAFILAPQLISLIIAIGLAIIGAEVLSLIGNTAVDKVFKVDRTNNEYRIDPAEQTPRHYEHDMPTVAKKCELTAEAMQPSRWTNSRSLPIATKVPEAAVQVAEDSSTMSSLLMAMPTIIAVREYGAMPCR